MFNVSYSEFIVLLMAWPFFGWVACAFFASHVAESKNLSRIFWLFGGLLFGPIALLAVCGMAKKSL